MHMALWAQKQGFSGLVLLSKLKQGHFQDGHLEQTELHMKDRIRGGNGAVACYIVIFL